MIYAIMDNYVMLIIKLISNVYLKHFGNILKHTTTNISIIKQILKLVS